MHRGTATLRNGLLCEYDQEGRRVAMDMPVAIGGGDQNPSPGFFGRAAICGCIAIGIRMAAARADLGLGEIRVDIEQVWDNRGLLGIAGVGAGPRETRVAIGIECDIPSDQIEALVAKALAHDPWLLAFRDAQSINTSLRILREGL